jgi:hypothetical protein
MSTERALERIEEAESAAGLRERHRRDQYEAYEKTFRALADVTPADDDEGITVVSRWIADRIRSEGSRPGSRAVRRRAREYCEANGYDVSDDDWLGV